MLKTILALSTVLFTQSAMSQNNVRLEIKSLPPYHPAGSDIYAAGSFNGWNPQDNNYRFQRTANGDYYLELKLDRKMIIRFWIFLSLIWLKMV